MAKILIVEDTADVARALAIRVAACGHTAIVAGDAASGTAMAMAEQPDLVLLDIGMPAGEGWGMARAGGLAVADRLRKNRQTTHTPVIFLTANSDGKVRERAMDFHPAAFLEKPYSADVLMHEVANALTI